MHSPYRWIAIGLALVAAAALALSIQGNAWWTIDQVTVGPFGTIQCFSGECHQTGLGWLRASAMWSRSATATGAGGTIAGFALILLAGTIAAGRVPRLIAKTTLVALGTAVVAAVGFIVTFPPIGEASLGAGAALFAAGIGLGAAAAILVLRTRA